MKKIEMKSIQAKNVEDGKQQLKLYVRNLLEQAEAEQKLVAQVEQSSLIDYSNLTQNELESSNRDPIIARAWWSSSRMGEKITRARLEDTVYFNFETRRFPEGTKFSLKLFDYDTLYIHPLYRDRDDDLFSGKEITREVTIPVSKPEFYKRTRHTFSIPLNLDPSWEQMLDEDKFLFQDKAIDLYWQISYKSGSKEKREEQPKDTDDYLKVFFSERTLYIKSPAENYNMPEMISYEGDLVVPVFQRVKSLLKTKMVDKMKDVLNDGMKQGMEDLNNYATAKRTEIAFMKLKRGDLVTNMGNIYQDRAIYTFNEVYDINNELHQKVERGNNFKRRVDGRMESTIGINQATYFTNNGEEVKRWITVGRASKVTYNIVDMATGPIGDLLDFGDFITNENAMDEPLPLGMIHPIGLVSEIVMADLKRESDEFLEEDFLLELEKAKVQGLTGVRKFVNSPMGERLNFRLIPIYQNETLQKILLGELKSIDLTRRFDEDLTDAKFDADDAYEYPQEPAGHILYRIVNNNFRDADVQILETIILPY